MNTIALAQKYLPILDAVYKRESLTARFDVANDNIKFDGTNEVKLYVTDMDGLGDYSRQNGFVNGSVEGRWEGYKLERDRSRSFDIDVMDNEETLGMAFGTTVSEFIRTKVVPEIDAYRFSKYASTVGISGTSADITVGTTDVPGLIDLAESTMNDDEVPTEGRVLIVGETAYRGLKAKITRILANENGVQRNIEFYDDMPVIRVPKGRFNKGITLLDGASVGQEKGGFVVPAGTSYPINFMIVHPSAVRQLAKHVVPRIFSPEVNQQKDAWKFDYRIYHDAWVLNQKVKGIYAHVAATANS